jgi:hypothetical protein
VILGPEDIVVEAELFRFLSYGWEIEESENASGGCYIHLREGAGDIQYNNLEFDPAIRSGDFYNITRSKARVEARCYFDVPVEGEYFLAVRTMAERSNCSNMFKARVDDGDEFFVGHNGSVPFVWLWHVPTHMVLKKGLHSIHFFTYQDGVSVDQAILTRKSMDLSHARTFAGGYSREAGPSDDLRPLTVSLSVDTLSVTADPNPKVAFYIRKTGQEERRIELQTSLDLPSGRTRERSREVILPADASLVKIPHDVELPRPLDRREYLLRCRALDGTNAVQERTCVFYHPYDWSILGPIPFTAAPAGGESEMNRAPVSSYSFVGQAHTWQMYNERFSDHYGVMDFGKLFCGRSFDAMTNVSLYAYTEIEVGRGGDYLLKAQGDDNLVVWINGAKVASIGRQKETVIRSAAEIRVPLNAGRNKILFRLNQISGQWQAGIRFRTADDKVADIVGVPFARQSASLDPRSPEIPPGVSAPSETPGRDGSAKSPRPSNGQAPVGGL